MGKQIKNRKTNTKEYSLNRFFLLFLAHAVLSFLFVTGLWVCLLVIATTSHILLPANAVERAVADWQATLDRHAPVTPEDIPEGAGYAFFDQEGALLETDLPENALQDAAKLALSEDRIGIRRSASGVFLRIDTNTTRIIVSYRLRASFAPPLLKRLFPAAELFLFLSLLFLLLADFVFIALRYARKFNRELQKLSAAAEKIRRQDLDFTAEPTKIVEFRKVMDSLDRLKCGLQQALEEQWAMQQQKKRQFSALAHDIKTPLAIVSGNAELLAETKLTKAQQEYTSFILEHAGQIRRYVAGMLALSGPDLPVSSVCDTEKLLSEIRTDAEQLGKSKHLSCLLHAENLPATLPLPEDTLRRILTNLTDNAVQYSPEGGSIFVTASIREDVLCLSVRDEGEGFSPEALALAATEFYRGDKSRTSREHFGLGLFIAGQLLAELGGTLHLENAPEGGALVKISIPLKKSPESL